MKSMIGSGKWYCWARADAVLDVADDDQRAQGRLQVVVAVGARPGSR